MGEIQVSELSHANEFVCTYTGTCTHTQKLIKYINNIKTYIFLKNRVTVYDTVEKDSISFWLTAFNQWEFKIRPEGCLCLLSSLCMGEVIFSESNEHTNTNSKLFVLRDNNKDFP